MLQKRDGRIDMIGLLFRCGMLLECRGNGAGFRGQAIDLVRVDAGMINNLDIHLQGRWKIRIVPVSLFSRLWFRNRVRCIRESEASSGTRVFLFRTREEQRIEE
jgi:hypothetical protein